MKPDLATCPKPGEEADTRFRSGLLSILAGWDLYPDAVLMLDPADRVGYANHQAGCLLARDVGDLIGQRFDDLLAVEDEVGLRRSPDSLLGRKPAEREFHMVTGDDLVVAVWARWIEISNNGSRPSIIMCLRDTTELNRTRHAKDDFIGLVSHELRGPLATVIGVIGTVLSEEERLSKEDVRGLLGDALLEAEALSDLLGNLVELARHQAGRLVLYAEPTRVLKSIESAVERTKRQHPSSRFSVEVPFHLPMVLADEVRVERTLCNLLENAAKHSPEGSEIKVTARSCDGNVLVAVADSGPGIPPADQARIFEPFEQVGCLGPARDKGMGLGLMVCKRLVEAQGGRIWVESAGGEGATFQFTLPAADARRLPAEASPAREAAKPARTGV